jgi:archaellum component FlaD/FlaE
MSYSKFAHLMGFKKKASEDEDDDKEKGKKAKSRRAEEERDDDEDAEEEDDREDMEDDDDSDPDAEEDDDKEKGKKAKSRRAEEDDDADAEEDDENRDVKKGRRAERKRCAAIFGSKHAAGRPDMAAHLAFSTRMSASEAIGTLATMGAVAPVKSARVSLDSRMQTEQVRLGPDGGKSATGKNALVSKMTSLYDTARGNK